MKKAKPKFWVVYDKGLGRYLDKGGTFFTYDQYQAKPFDTRKQAQKHIKKNIKRQMYAPFRFAAVKIKLTKKHTSVWIDEASSFSSEEWNLITTKMKLRKKNGKNNS